MSKHIISVPLSEDGIQSAIEQLRIYQNSVEAKKKVLLQKLAEIGVREADTTYMNPSINVVSVGDGYKVSVIAFGKEVCFIEFGAGVDTNMAHPYASEVPFDVIPGSWSVQDAQQFYTWGYWYYGGEKLTGVESRPGMLNASREIQRNVLRVAREVFK